MATSLTSFGQIKIERGEMPEAGSVRFFLVGRSGRKDRARAAIYLGGEPGATSVAMDSNSEKLGNAIWSGLKRRCHLQVLGEPR